jgi:hypothetical protein
MNRTLLLVLFLLVENLVSAQQWDGATNSTNYISRTGNVGIGTNLNVDKFNLSGNLRMIDGVIKFGYKPFVIAGYPNSYYDIEYYNDGLYFFPSNEAVFINEVKERRGLFLSNSFRVGIGTDNTDCESCDDYRLFVKDGIRTERVKVDVAASNGWADYVFDKEYKLTDLKTLENYILENKHLPEVPTTEEAIQNGIELKEMNILLLKKVEELTLYAIEQEKRADDQQNQIDELKSENKQFQQQQELITQLLERVNQLETSSK